MPTKVFTTLGGKCPFGRNIEIDSAGCRQCECYYRTGTGTFFWCNCTEKPAKRKPKKKKTEPTVMVQIKRKPGRPPKDGQKKPVNGREKKNG